MTAMRDSCVYVSQPITQLMAVIRSLYCQHRSGQVSVVGAAAAQRKHQGQHGNMHPEHCPPMVRAHASLRGWLKLACTHTSATAYTCMWLGWEAVGPSRLL